MGANLGKQGRALAARFQTLSQESRNQVLGHGRPGAFDPLTAVEGIFAHDALAPSVDAFTVDGHQENAAAVGATKARLEKVDERHLNFTQSNGFNFHDLSEILFTTQAQRY